MDSKSHKPGTRRWVLFLLTLLIGGLGAVLVLSLRKDVTRPYTDQDVPGRRNVRNPQVGQESLREVGSKFSQPLRRIGEQVDHRSISFGQIDVKGTVLDQHGQPLANIAVDFTVDQSGPYAPARKKGSTSTDAAGNFRISGYEGTAVGIYPKAEGYMLVATNNRVIYSGFARDNPLHRLSAGTDRVILMWKLAGAQ